MNTTLEILEDKSLATVCGGLQEEFRAPPNTLREEFHVLERGYVDLKIEDERIIRDYYSILAAQRDL